MGSSTTAENVAMKQMQIGGRRIGAGEPVYVIAEMSANHGQDFDEAVRIIRAIKDSGADAVKIQTYTPDTLTIDCDNEYFRIGEGTIWEGRTLYSLYGEAYTPWEWHAPLKAEADAMGLDFFSSPFDETAVDLLEELDVPAYKIASFELVDLALIRRVARTGKPIIFSTGMAALGEIDEALGVATAAGAEEAALLKCTSAYPSPASEMNLRTIPNLAETFGVPVGLSDHTLGIAVPVAAAALGACIVEKHFTMSRDVPGPDSAFSLEPAEFRAMVDAIRVATDAVGQIRYGIGEKEEHSRVFRRSLFVVEDMRAGDVFDARNLRSIRPGFGLAPRHIDDVMGRRASRDIQRGTPLDWALIAGK